MIELSVNYAYIDAARCFDKLVRPDIVMSVPVFRSIGEGSDISLNASDFFGHRYKGTISC